MLSYYPTKQSSNMAGVKAVSALLHEMALRQIGAKPFKVAMLISYKLKQRNNHGISRAVRKSRHTPQVNLLASWAIINKPFNLIDLKTCRDCRLITYKKLVKYIMYEWQIYRYTYYTWNIPCRNPCLMTGSFSFLGSWRQNNHYIRWGTSVFAIQDCKH